MNEFTQALKTLKDKQKELTRNLGLSKDDSDRLYCLHSYVKWLEQVYTAFLLRRDPDHLASEWLRIKSDIAAERTACDAYCRQRHFEANQLYQKEIDRVQADILDPSTVYAERDRWKRRYESLRTQFLDIGEHVGQTILYENEITSLLQQNEELRKRLGEL